MIAANEALGLLETHGYTPALAAIDAMEKSGDVRVLQIEVNDMLGVMIKLAGPVADVRAALEAGKQVATAMQGRPIAHAINRPTEEAMRAITSPREVSPLTQQDVVKFPRYETVSSANSESGKQSSKTRDLNMSSESFALGLIETQGFTAVFEAIDSACKAANVEVLGKEKLGGGYITIIIRGDVAAVKAAVEAGRSKVEGLGKLIAAHVIARPSAGALGLLPKV